MNLELKRNLLFVKAEVGKIKKSSDEMTFALESELFHDRQALTHTIFVVLLAEACHLNENRDVRYEFNWLGLLIHEIWYSLTTGGPSNY